MDSVVRGDWPHDLRVRDAHPAVRRGNRHRPRSRLGRHGDNAKGEGKSRGTILSRLTSRITTEKRTYELSCTEKRARRFHRRRELRHRGARHKLAFAHGFTWQQTTAGQSTFGVIIFGIVLLIQILRGAKFAGLDAKTLLQLLGKPAPPRAAPAFSTRSRCRICQWRRPSRCCSSSWIGIVIQMIVTHRPPNAAEIAAALIVMTGTVLASGLFSHEIAGMNPVGVACGLISAVSCALFMFFSGRWPTTCRPFSAASSSAWGRPSSPTSSAVVPAFGDDVLHRALQPAAGILLAVPARHPVRHRGGEPAHRACRPSSRRPSFPAPSCSPT